MGRTEMVIAISVALFLAFFVGWVLRWIYGSLNRINSANLEEVDELANRLHVAEEARDHTVAEYEARERELTAQLAQANAELSAAMEGLGQARRDAEALRQQLGQ
ncbi:MAG: hypothetical protein AAF826_01815 [Pseudomonadota bacterium]